MYMISTGEDVMASIAVGIIVAIIFGIVISAKDKDAGDAFFLILFASVVVFSVLFAIGTFAFCLLATIFPVLSA